MFINAAYAQTALSGSASTYANIIQWAPLFLIGGVFYFLLIMPQQRQAKDLKNKLKALKRGDKVVTAGGIIGTVKKTTEGSDNIDIEIAPNVTVSVVRATITTVTADKGDKV